MKNFLITLFLISLSALSAQQVSDYKYIIIPEKFSGFDENQYQLNRYLGFQLNKKNYETLSQEPVSWPLEVRQNPCLALKSDVEKNRSFLKNKLEIVFTDCNNKEIARLEGESKIKEYDKGYQDAMKTALNAVKTQNAQPVSQQETITNEPVMETVKISEPVENNVQPNENASVYKNGEISLTKSDLKDGSFSLIRENNAQIFAQFYPSSKPGVFHVKMMNPNGENYFTIGYMSGNSISIEMQNGSNQWKLAEFKN